MKKIKNKFVAQDVITDVICDCCGKSCNTEYDPEYMTLKANWGYMSNHDLETWEAHLCERCVETKLSFIPFNKTNSISGSKL